MVTVMWESFSEAVMVTDRGLCKVPVKLSQYCDRWLHRGCRGNWQRKEYSKRDVVMVTEKRGDKSCSKATMLLQMAV